MQFVGVISFFHIEENRYFIGTSMQIEKDAPI